MKRAWTVQELLDQLAVCVSDEHCAERCNEEPCVLESSAFIQELGCKLENQRSEIHALRQANEGQKFMIKKLREELQAKDEAYQALRRKTLLEVEKLLEEM